MQPNMNPYGAPQYPQPAYGGYGPPPGWGPAAFGPTAFVPTGTGGFAAKWFALASMVGVIGSIVGLLAVAAEPGHSDPSGVEIIPCVTMGLSVIGWVASCLTWVYRSWEFLPYAYRRNAAGKAFSPGEAVGFMFIPLFNLYWAFAQNLGYCEALDSALVQNGHTARAPRTLATIACVFQVIPYLNFFVAPFGWLVYMFVADGAKAQLRGAR